MELAMYDKLVDKIAKSIKDETDQFSDPVEYYIRGEACTRGIAEKNDFGGVTEDGYFESYRIIARRIVADLCND